MQKVILAVDGNSVINRAYFGVRPLTNGKGQRTEAIYGMLHIILSQAERVHPDGVAVAFDLHAPTFRHKMYDGYKSNRHGMDEELRCQMEPAKKLLDAMGYAVLSCEGYEGDDILGTVSRKATEEGDTCYILTGDRDSLQLINENTSVLLIGKGETVLYDRAVFFEKYGIMPEQFADAKALMGDSSDCIPGVPGIGEKTALPMIARFGSVDGVYEHLDDPYFKGAVKSKLENNRESAYLSKELAVIFKEVPIEKIPTECKRKPELYDILKELEFSSVIAKLGVTEQTAEGTAKEKERSVSYQAASWEKLLSLKGRMGIALKEDGLYVSAEEGNFFFEGREPSALATFFSQKNELAVYDCKTLYKELAKMGITGFEAADDPMLAGYVLSPTDNDYSMKALALSYLERITEEEQDAALTLELANAMRVLLQKNGEEELYKNIELPLAAVLARCENAGFLVDKQGIAAFSAKLEKGIAELGERIYQLAEQPFNINSPKQLGKVLFEDLHLPCPKKTKSGYSTSAEVLEKLKNIHPIINAILDYRQLSKLRSTYTEGLLKVAGEDGRIHTCFMQTVTATGRLSSVEPNLQNIPVRTEAGKEMRKFFVAPEGKKLIDADYSQVELRLLAAISGDETMIGAFNAGIDIHTVTAAEVFGVAPEEVTAAMRKQAKAVNFGIVYGISGFSLAEDIHVSVKEAENYIKNYFRTYPGIERYMKKTVENAKETGYVCTMFGRRREIPELTSGKGMLKKFGERVAMNSPIQGSAADIIKIAMINTDKALQEAGLDAKLILQVHDELIVEASEADAGKAAEILRENMENAAHLSVPLAVDLCIGDSWYDCK